MNNRTLIISTSTIIFTCMLGACTPQVQLKTPTEGITINLNVEVDHKIAIETDENTRAVLGEPQ